MKLKKMENIVLAILEDNEPARADDYVLYWLVCSKICPPFNHHSFSYILYNRKSLGLPNWESVTRCRRKIQEKRPDLLPIETARRRKSKIKEYKEYSKT